MARRPGVVYERVGLCKNDISHYKLYGAFIEI